MSGHPVSLCGRRLRDVLILISGLMLEIRFGYIQYTIQYIRHSLYKCNFSFL